MVVCCGVIAAVPCLPAAEAGWRPERLVSRRSTRDASPLLNNAMKAMIAAIQHNSDAWPFLEPVDTKQLPDYLDVVKEPIGVSAIRMAGA